MCVVEDCDDENAERVFLDTANESQHNEDIIYKDITDQDDTDEDMTNQDNTRTQHNPCPKDEPLKEDLCEDESILMNAIDEFPVDHLHEHHQPATSALEDQMAVNEGDRVENAMCEVDAISSAASCMATAGSSTKTMTMDSEDAPEEYSRMHLLVGQSRLMDQQRQDAMREQLNMAWQASLDYIQNRNAVAMTRVMDLLSYSRWKATHLRTEVEVLKSKLHDQICSNHQLLNLLTVREGEMHDMNNDIRELGAECAELMDEVSNLKKTKDQDNYIVECLKKEKADLQMYIQKLRELMDVKQMQHKRAVSQLTREKSELQYALLKSQARPE